MRFEELRERLQNVVLEPVAVLGYGTEGRSTLKLLLDYVRSFPDGAEALWSTSWVPGNEAAAKLYRDFGFVENGEMDGDEIVAVLKL